MPTPDGGRSWRTGGVRHGLVTAAVTGAVLVAAASAGFATLELSNRPQSQPAPAPERETLPEEAVSPPPSPQLSDGGSPLVRYIVTGIVVALAAVLVGLVLWLLLRWAHRLWQRLRSRLAQPHWLRMRTLPGGEHRAAPAPAPPAAEDEELLAAVDEAVQRSSDTADPRQAVIACWVRLEEAAAAAGVPRHDTDTATDLVVRLLRTRDVSEPVLSALAGAYRRARYAWHPVDEQMRREARSALQRLRTELDTPPEPTDPVDPGDPVDPAGSPAREAP